MTKDAPTTPSRASTWLFYAGLRDLRVVYEAARDGFDGDLRRNQREFDRLRKDPDISEDPVGYEHHLASVHDEIIRNKALLREAFVIMLFHFWERRAIAWTGVKGYDLAHIAGLLRSWGAAPREGELDLLRLTANTAKHSSGRSADDLFKVRPEAFDPNLFNEAPTYEALIISEEDLTSFFEAVEASGPPRKRLKF